MNKIISRKLATDAIDGIMTQLYHIALSGSAENAADQINFVTILQELVQLRHNDDYKTALEQMSMEGFTEYYTLFFDLVNAMGLESVKDLSDWRVVSTDTLPDSISRANRTREVVELLDGFNALELADVSFTDRMKTIERILGDLFVTDNKEQQILKILASMNAEEQSAFITRLTDDDNPLLERMLRKVGGKEKISLFQFLQTIFLASDLNIEGSANGPTLHNDPSNYQSVEARIRKGKIAVTQFGQVQINGAVTQTGSWELSPFDQVTYALRDESYTIPALFLTDEETLYAAVGKETLLSVIWGALQGEFNEDPTGKQILADIGINFIPIVGQVCDARDIAACLHKLINEGRVTDVMVWVTLLLTAIGCIPYAGDVVKGALKAIIKGADDVALMLVKKVGGDNIVQAIQIVSRKLDDALPELRRLIQGWAEEAAQKGSPNTAGFFSKMDEMINNSVRFIRDKIDEFGRKVGGEAEETRRLIPTEKFVTTEPLDAAGKLKPNIRYRSGEFNYFYETDELGRITKCEAPTLQRTERTERLVHDSKTPGKLKGDHAGHIIGDRFGGSPEVDNLVSQLEKVNLSDYKKLENDWAAALSRRERVEINIEIKYSGTTSRPSEFIVKYKIDGDLYPLISIPN